MTTAPILKKHHQQKAKKPDSHIPHHITKGFAACGVSMDGKEVAPNDEKPGCDRCKVQSEKSVYRRLRRMVFE